MHATIRATGRGAFSHWGPTLYFSSSDGTSPLENGRTYRAVAPLSATAWLGVLGVLSVICLVAYIGARLPERSRESLRRCARILAWPGQGSERLAIPVAAALAIVGSAIAWVIVGWQHAWTPNLSPAGLLPVSDAAGYLSCSNRFLDQSNFGPRASDYLGGWCFQRPIYSSALATILIVTGRYWMATLLVQAALLGLAMASLSWAIWRGFGAAAAILVLALVFVGASEWALSTTMTENAGLAFGATALAFLVTGVRVAKAWPMICGAALLSVALSARAGAFFVLLALVVWGLLWGPRVQASVWRTAVAVGLACAAGFMLQLLLTEGLGGQRGLAHGSFAYSLYGLAAGGQGWRQVLLDHPELVNPDTDAGARRILELALEKIKDSPQPLVRALWENLLSYVSDPLRGMFSGSLASILWLSGGLERASQRCAGASR